MPVQVDKLEFIDDRLAEELRLHCGCWFHDWTDQILAMRAMQALVWVSCANGIASLVILMICMKHPVFLFTASDPAMRMMLEFAAFGFLFAPCDCILTWCNPKVNGKFTKCIINFCLGEMQNYS